MSDVPRLGNKDNNKIKTYTSMTDNIVSQILYAPIDRLEGDPERNKAAEMAKELIWRIMDRNIYQILLKEDVEDDLNDTVMHTSYYIS